jgi:hypothetical protein
MNEMWVPLNSPGFLLFFRNRGFISQAAISRSLAGQISGFELWFAFIFGGLVVKIKMSFYQSGLIGHPWKANRKCNFYFVEAVRRVRLTNNFQCTRALAAPTQMQDSANIAAIISDKPPK